jgi:hypothetical protein
MAPIRITTKLESETLVLPELRPLVGKTVEIRVVEKVESESAIERLLDHELYATLEEEFANDPTPVLTLEEIRAITAKIPGSLSADVIADREERC